MEIIFNGKVIQVKEAKWEVQKSGYYPLGTLNGLYHFYYNKVSIVINKDDEDYITLYRELLRENTYIIEFDSKIAEFYMDIDNCEGLQFIKLGDNPKEVTINFIGLPREKEQPTNII